MRLSLREPPRVFSPLPGLELRDMGDLTLDLDEQVTLRTPSGRTNDIVRKDWGLYLSNSVNANLLGQGWRTALVVSNTSDPPRYYLNLIEVDKMESFLAYLREHRCAVACWLDAWDAEAR